jgi:peptide chain release factor 3
VLLSDAMKAKKLREALQQLAEEGVVQVFRPVDGSQPLVGVVGPLQFEVLQYRLETEYSAECRVESAKWQLVRWPLSDGAPCAERPDLLLPTGSVLATDASGLWVVLLPSAWTAGYLEEKNKDFTFSAEPPRR